MRFRPVAGLADSSALADRTEVTYTVDGTCWFYGRTLPVQRTAATGQEIIEYIAADPIFVPWATFQVIGNLRAISS
jgi:hypothetical protein